MITKDMTIGEIIAKDHSKAIVLMEMGMGCVGCPSSSGETVEEAAMVHGLQVETLLEALNK